MTSRAPVLKTSLTLPLILSDDGAAVFLASLTGAAIAEASFLDQRLLGPGLVGQWSPWHEMMSRAASLGEALDYIFHIGHVGSTLLSRLLGRLPSILSLREPAVLRTFAQSSLGWSPETSDARLAAALALWSQTLAPNQRVLLKATSFVSEMAPTLLARTAPAKAIFLTASLPAYLATILGGANSKTEARHLASSRLDRLHRRLGRAVWDVAMLSDGEIIAMSWASEMSALADAWSARPALQVLAMDFDRFLAAPRAHVEAALRHLTGAAPADQVAAILESPDFARYSKAPEHAYDAALRRQVMARARHEHADALHRGMIWFDRAASQFPRLGNTLELWRKSASI